MQCIFGLRDLDLTHFSKHPKTYLPSSWITEDTSEIISNSFQSDSINISSIIGIAITIKIVRDFLAPG